MKKIFLKDFKRGWVVGNFEPTLLKTNDIEVAIQTYKSGDEQLRHYHKIGTEISIIILGSASFNNQILNEHEGLIIYPNELNKFKALTDCKILVIKYPSITDDKYLVDDID